VRDRRPDLAHAAADLVDVEKDLADARVELGQGDQDA